LCDQITAEELGALGCLIFWFWIALKLVDSLAELLADDAQHRKVDRKRNWHFGTNRTSKAVKIKP